MGDPTSRIARQLEAELVALDGVSRIYISGGFGGIARSLGDGVAADAARRPRVSVQNGVVTATIGTAAGSVAREVVHEVEEVARACLQRNNLHFVRVDIKIATIGI